MDPRNQVAIEAARLIYHGKVEEYIDAKKQAMVSLGINAMPSNFEVAVELNCYAQEVEGPDRYRRLIKMREVALQVMSLIGEYQPHLIGSVWRGTAHKGSDIDIIVFHGDHEEVKEKISEIYQISDIQTVNFYSEGVPRHSSHIRIESEGYPVEIVVRPSAEKEPERCEIYGDIKRGIGLSELERLIKSDPLRRFIPRRRG